MPDGVGEIRGGGRPGWSALLFTMLLPDTGLLIPDWDENAPVLSRLHIHSFLKRNVVLIWRSDRMTCVHMADKSFQRKLVWHA